VKDFSTFIPNNHSMGLEDEIEDLREEIAETPYNKSTEAHIGRLKSKLAEKKEKLENQSSAGGGQGYSVEQTGDATVALVGVPSAGKSTLLNALTNAESEVGSYDFTTLDVNPGMLKHKGANIQLLDVPGLIEGAAGGRGGGQEVLSVIRTADLVVFVLSVFEIEQYEPLREELEANKVRLDTRPPKVRITPKGMGGIDVTMASDVGLEPDTVREVLREHGHVNADVAITEPVDLDQLLDGVIDNRVYLPSLVAVNKADLIDRDYLETVNRDLRAQDIDPDEAIFISAEEEKGLDVLRERIWKQLELIRVYMDKPGRGTDYEEPLVLQEGQTVGDACEKLGGDLEERFRFARVSGESAKHDEQQVGTDHTLRDEDVLRIIARR
jgi:ribosome-interacting GTPase 1